MLGNRDPLTRELNPSRWAALHKLRVFLASELTYLDANTAMLHISYSLHPEWLSRVTKDATRRFSGERALSLLSLYCPERSSRSCGGYRLFPSLMHATLQHLHLIANAAVPMCMSDRV